MIIVIKLFLCSTPPCESMFDWGEILFHFAAESQDRTGDLRISLGPACRSNRQVSESETNCSK